MSTHFLSLAIFIVLIGWSRSIPVLSDAPPLGTISNGRVARKSSFWCMAAEPGSSEDKRARLGNYLVTLVARLTPSHLSRRKPLVKTLQAFKGGVMIVSHDQHFINKVCMELWVVGKGEVVKYGGTFDDYKSEQVAKRKLSRQNR